MNVLIGMLVILLIYMIIYYTYYEKPNTFIGEIEGIGRLGSKVGRRILTISCYGYGNMGDNMYSAVFGHYLRDCEIKKVSDHSVFVDSEGKFHREPPKVDYDFDYLIFGGGGVLTDNKLANSSNMRHYLNIAMKKRKPLFIISCGLQGEVNNFKAKFKSWKVPFDYASLITVRSPTDKQLIDTMTDSDKVFYFRDLGYVFPHIVNIPKHPRNNKILTLIIAGPVDEKNETILKEVKNYDKVIIVNMGALVDDNNNKRMLNMDFPGVEISKFYGAGRAKEFTNGVGTMITDQKRMEQILENDKIDKYNPSDLTLEILLEIIYNSDLVYTGRYHGMVFSRSLEIPNDTLGMGTNKILWELPETSASDMVFSAYNNIKMLREKMGLDDTSYNDLENLARSTNR